MGRTAPPKPGRIFYGWYIVASGFALLSLGYGTRYSYSVFFPSVIEQFGWPRDLAASILSLHLICYGLTAPLAGFLVDRVGPRRSMLSGAVLLSLGMILSGFSQNPWHFYLTFGLLAGVGLCLLASAPLTVVVRNWFERRRGTAISLLFLGEGLAYACYPAVVWLIRTFGWRRAISLEGVIVAAVFIPLLWLVMESRPENRGLTKDGLSPGEENDRERDRLEALRVVDREWAAQDWSLLRAVKTLRYFLVCFSSFCIWGVGHHILVTHQIAFALDAGYERLYASSVISLGGPAFGLGCLASVVSDRIGREWSMTLGTLISVSGILALVLIRDVSAPWLLYYYALAFGFGFGICVPMVAAVATDIFQGPHAGATIGSVWLSFAMGGALGPWLGGRFFEVFKGYGEAFVLAAAIQTLGCGAVWLAGPRQVRLVPGRARG